MPHKRAKRSVREAERKNRQTDLAPTPLGSEPIPKGIARVLGAEATRAAFKARKNEEPDKGKKSKEGGIRPGETLGEFNRRVEEAHRPLVRAAMKHTGKGKGKKDEGAVKGKRKRDEADEGEAEREEVVVKEFQTFKSSAPRRLHDVALAPPVLTSAPRGVEKSKNKPGVSMARRVVLEQERERAITMYRAHKAAKVSGE